ncbi:MAG: hypothetical protein IT373_09060 [Polyangiaceae bacterium]|nr:hypothetical protein [Polyangiaceae bacterium]
MKSSTFAPSTLAALAAVVALACTATNKTGFGGTGGEGAGTTGGGGAGATGTGGSFGGGLNTGGGTGGTTELVAEVFGHSASQLYMLDPVSKAVTTVGTFSGCSSVIDIALDKDGAIYATTFDGLYRIDKTNAACTFVSSGGYPNSLSFVPVGTVDPNVEALVGYQGDTYVRIDTSSGNVSTIGAIGGGYTSSGDIVSVIGGKTYLTAFGTGCPTDCLLEVNPTTGAMVHNYGLLTGYDNVFGLAFWGGAAYGFTDAGQLFQIDFAGNGVTTSPIAIPGAPAGLSFWGAGSATSAPVIIPN